MIKLDFQEVNSFRRVSEVEKERVIYEWKGDLSIKIEYDSVTQSSPTKINPIQYSEYYISWKKYTKIIRLICYQHNFSIIL